MPGLPPGPSVRPSTISPSASGAANIAVLERVIQDINATAPGQPQALLLDVSVVKLARQDYAGANAVMAEYQRLAHRTSSPPPCDLAIRPKAHLRPCPRCTASILPSRRCFLSCDPKYLEIRRLPDPLRRPSQSRPTAAFTSDGRGRNLSSEFLRA